MIKAREYEASLWARKDEEIRFHIKFSKGSHVNFTWMLEESINPSFVKVFNSQEDLGSNFAHVEKSREQCQLKATPSDPAALEIKEQVHFKQGS